MMKTLAIAVAFLLPAVVSAATAAVYVDTGENVINSLEGAVGLPLSATIDSVEDGDSVLLIWLEKPVVFVSARAVAWSGITPGGFSGRRKVLSFNGTFTKADVARAQPSGVTALLNDGKGTRVPVRIYVEMVDSVSDAISPDPFSIMVSESPELFGGEPFIAFLSQDKQSGIDRYEYASTHFFNPDDSQWRKVESPLLIPQEDRSRKLYVRAVDRAGNTHTVWIAGPGYYKSLIGWAILILSLIACALFYRKRFYLR